MEKPKNNYDEIDELIRPIIEYLNEVMGVKTVSSSQGKSMGEDGIPKYGYDGYIMCIYSKRSFNIFNHLLDKFNNVNTTIELWFDTKHEKFLTFRINTTFLSKDEHKALWNDVLECLKNYRYGKSRKMYSMR